MRWKMKINKNIRSDVIVLIDLEYENVFLVDFYKYKKNLFVTEHLTFIETMLDSTFQEVSPFERYLHISIAHLVLQVYWMNFSS